MERKIRREEEKHLKIFRGVFDRRTLLILYNFIKKGIYKEIIGIIKEGKENVILIAKTREGKIPCSENVQNFSCEF